MQPQIGPYRPWLDATALHAEYHRRYETFKDKIVWRDGEYEGHYAFNYRPMEDMSSQDFVYTNLRRGGYNIVAPLPQRYLYSALL